MKSKPGFALEKTFKSFKSWKIQNRDGVFAANYLQGCQYPWTIRYLIYAKHAKEALTTRITHPYSESQKKIAAGMYSTARGMSEHVTL